MLRERKRIVGDVKTSRAMKVDVSRDAGCRLHRLKYRAFEYSSGRRLDFGEEDFEDEENMHRQKASYYQ